MNHSPQLKPVIPVKVFSVKKHMLFEFRRYSDGAVPGPKLLNESNAYAEDMPARVVLKILTGNADAEDILAA